MNGKSRSISQPDKVLQGRYKITKKLGRGGFGFTSIAEDLHRPNHPECVVKELSPRMQNSNGLTTKNRFETEAEVLEKLGKHDQIPQLLAYFKENGKFYLVLEFVEGNNLVREIAPNKKQSEDKVLALLLDILPVLEFVHKNGAIHRDIKPSNLIRRYSDGKIALIDFGAVKEFSNLEVNEDQLIFTHNIGTPGYKPLEQVNGKPKPNSDIYALGMVVIQALTGLPICELNNGDFSKEIVWREYAPNVSTAFANILDRMVRQNFEQRFQSAQEVLDALNKVNEPTTSVVEGGIAPDCFLDRNEPATEKLNALNKAKPASVVEGGISQLPPTPQGERQNRQNFSMHLAGYTLAGYPLIAVLFLWLAIPGYSTLQIVQRQILEKRYQPFEFKIDPDKVCEKTYIYKDEYKDAEKAGKNLIPGKAFYQEKFRFGWPIFYWRCQYELVDKNDSFDRETKNVGMDLDKYCKTEFPDDKTKPSHHDHLSRNVYCTYPHPK